MYRTRSRYICKWNAAPRLVCLSFTPGSLLALHQKNKTDGASTLQFYTFPRLLEMFAVKKTKKTKTRPCRVCDSEVLRDASLAGEAAQQSG